MGIRTLNVTKNKENTIVIPLFDHEGNPILSDINGKQAKIEVHGRDSSVFKKAVFEVQKTLKDIESGKEKDSIAKQENRNIFVTKAVIVGWDNVTDFDEKGNAVELEFTDENVEAILRSEPHIVEQIDKAMSDRAKFVKKTD